MTSPYRKTGSRLYFDVDDLNQAQDVLSRFVPPMLQRTMRYIEAVAPDGRAIVLKNPEGETGRLLEKTTELMPVLERERESDSLRQAREEFRTIQQEHARKRGQE